MKQLLKGFAIICLLPACSSAPQESSNPNIVIIYADDMGYGDVAFQNPESKIPTPNLDRLASEGIHFTDAHSSSGICTPSRYALLTGSYHWRRFHGIVNAFDPPVFKSGDLTIPAMLQSKGYRTACIGKWHLGWDWDSIKNPGAVPEKVAWDGQKTKIIDNATEDQKRLDYWTPESFDWSKPVTGGPIDWGFDYYFGDDVINFPPYTWIENDRFLDPPAYDFDLQGRKTMEGSWEFRPGPMAKDWDPYDVLPSLTQKAVEYINDQTSDTPFFLYFSLPSPHAPIIPNIEFQGKSGAGGYGDFVYQTDWVIGQVLEALKQNGMDKNTLVIFTSDNGPEHYAFERERTYGHSSSGGLRGVKRDVWEGGHRVPFIIRWPGVVEPGVVSDEVISQVDIMATFASIVNYSLPDDTAPDSYNLIPILKGENYNQPLREATVHNTYENKFAIRKGKWLYINHESGEHTKMPDWYISLKGYEPLTDDGQLFDMSIDKEQRKNLFHEHSEIVEELKTLLNKYRNLNKSVSHATF